MLRCADETPVASSERTARLILTAFLATFIVARCLVLLIMSRRVPDLYVYAGGTHVHHLNYGIFLLAGVGGYLLLRRASAKQLKPAAVIYGIGLGLTFDEFGMWLHLGGGYWQRCSLDAVAVIAASLGLIAVAPRLRDFRPRHWWTATLLAAGVVLFALLAAESFRYVGRTVGPALRTMDQRGPP